MDHVGGIILAGGQARRMGGGDKCLKTLGGRTLLSRIIERVRPQISHLILSANGDPERFKEFGLPTLPDAIGDSAGPLAGILTGMEWMRKYHKEVEWLASFPGDAPFVPLDFVNTILSEISEGAEIVCAKSGGRAHPVCALWRVNLSKELRFAMMNRHVRKIDEWSSQYKLFYREFSAEPADPFFNINSREDLALAETLI